MAADQGQGKGQRLTRERLGQRVGITPRRGQSAESVEADFARSFAVGDTLLADGVQEWRSTIRRFGSFKVMAYKEVGPPPWRWPRLAVQPHGRFVRFIVGWRSTAFALCILRSGGESHA